MSNEAVLSPYSRSPGAYMRLGGELNDRLAAARPRLARLARLNGATASEAEDIAQETLLAAWRSLDHLRAPERFDAWLDGICRNISRHAARRALTEQARFAPKTDAESSPDGDPLALAPASHADPLDELTQRELTALLDSALGLLNESSREAVRLRYLAELPGEEAAARLGLSVNALEARLSRARKQLRAALNGPLRERAIEFDLALADADEAGWRETSIWCHFCGQARMRGALGEAPDGGGRLMLQCPLCWRECGITETTIPSSPALVGLNAFRPALKRVMAHAVTWSAERERLETTCFRCGATLPARMGQFGEMLGDHDLPPRFAAHYSAFYSCPACDRDGGGGASGSGAAATSGRAHPAVQRFITERQRWIIEPDTRVEYQGAPAIRFSLHDLATDERIAWFADPTTLAVRAVIKP